MIDPKYLRQDITIAEEKLRVRGYQLDTARINELEARRKELQVKVQDLQSQRNQLSKQIGQQKAAGTDASDLMAQVKSISDELLKIDVELEQLLAQLKDIHYSIPNIPHESVPEGATEDDNIEVKKFGEPNKFSFAAKDHITLGEGIGQLDFSAAAKLTGSRFVVMHRQLAQLHRALAQFMLDVHTEEHGYQEVYVPFIVNQDSLYGTGQLPKFAEDQFKLYNDNEYYLIPTAEVPVTNLLRDEIVAGDQLPIKRVAHTPCFRSEAGSYGKDTRGMIRQHQFEKVELVWIVKPEESYQALEQLLSDAERILQKLQLPYRVVTLCGGDLGFGATKTYDIEVWLPGQDRYREISSCSNCEDFQARRMQARFKTPVSKKPSLVHTLNGSGLAVGRTLIAVMENYQDEQGNIHIPEVLWPYMKGLRCIKSVNSTPVND